MGTPCDPVEGLFRAGHLDWTKLECIEFYSELWMSNEAAGFGIGFDTSIKARRNFKYKPLTIIDEFGEWSESPICMSRNFKGER